MSWTQEFNAVFFLTLCTLACGSLGLAMRLCMRSKCEDLNLCCGLLSVHRNVELELASERVAAAAKERKGSNPSTPEGGRRAEEEGGEDSSDLFLNQV